MQSPKFVMLYFHAKSTDKSKKYHQIKFALGAILIIYTFILSYIKLKAKNIIKSRVIHHKKAMIMQNLNQVLGNKFDKLYFHAKNLGKK